MRPVILYCAAILAFSNCVFGARILGLFPHTGKSHYMVFEPLLKKLTERGHHVTVASFFPQKNPPANYTDISLDGMATHGFEFFDLNWIEGDSIFRVPVIGSLMRRMSSFDPLGWWALNVCRNAVDWPPLNEALNREYDVVLVENFNSDCMLGLLHVHNINAPVVAMLTTNMLPWSPERIGAVDIPSYTPMLSAEYNSRMSFLERIQNTFLKIYHRLWFRYRVQLKEQEIIEKHFGRKIPDLENIARNISLMIVNTYHVLTGAKPLVPGLIQVGGIHLDPTKKFIPEYMERFLNESEHGVILLSFGSLIKSSTMPKYKEEIIVNTLSKLKQRVIWKYEDSAEEGTLTGNILRVRWLPQYELLQHNKIIAFIAHGGLLGMTEAVSAGKPMVVVPFFGDQPANAAAAAASGFAKVVSYDVLNEGDLTNAIQSVLSAEFRMNARRTSKMWNDRESSPLDTAVFWVERVSRWGHSAPLHTSARELAFYELALLDVAAAYLLAFGVLIAIIWYLLSKISQIFFRAPKQKMH